MSFFREISKTGALFRRRMPVFLRGDGAVLRYGLAGRIGSALRLLVSRFRPHPYTLYEPNPEWRSSDGRSRHNSLGFRGADLAGKLIADAILADRLLDRPTKTRIIV